MRKAIRPKEDMYRFNLVLPRNLILKVEKMAQDNRRSVTQQIISSLEWATREVRLDEPTQPS